MSLTLFPLPLNSPIVEEARSQIFGKAFVITRPWAEALRARDERLQSAAHTETTATITANQTAAIAATPIITAAAAGRYRISASLAQTVAAGVSASFQITIKWTQNLVVRSRVGTLVNGNTTASGDQMPSFMVRADAGSNITYEVSYASNPAATAAFILDVTAEAMG